MSTKPKVVLTRAGEIVMFLAVLVGALVIGTLLGIALSSLLRGLNL